MNNRAKQFMPFAALKGYYEIIKERSRIYEEKKELSEDEAAVLSDKIASIEKGKIIKITYYKEFDRGEGYIPEGAFGAYVTAEGMVSEINTVTRTVTVVKTVIPFDDILDIGGEGIKNRDF